MEMVTYIRAAVIDSDGKKSMIRFILSCPFIQHYKVEKRLVSFSTLFYYVCQYGWQPNSGKRIAKGKGFIAKWNLKKADGEHLMESRQTS